MASVFVERRAESAESVATALDIWADSIGTQLQQTLEPYLQPGESLAEPRMWAVLIARHMRASVVPLRAADAAHEAEAGDDPLPLQARNKARDTLYTALTTARERLGGAYGSPALTVLGFAGPTPREGAPLLAFGTQVLTALEQPCLPTLRDPQDAHVIEGVRVSIRAGLASLRTAQSKVVEEARELTVTAARRNAEIARHEALFTQSAGLGTALLRLAGQGALADRLRPSARRRGLTVAAESEPTPEDEPTDDPSGS